METESHFNPRARFAVPALGLMQLVPRSGAMDSYRHVYGEKVLLGPDYLYEADQNVELGAGYLNLLNTRYLRAVTNDQSREYCIIAAYNTGAGNVANSFTDKTNVRKAAPMINALTPQEVYDHLVANLPYEETRHYLHKVTTAKKKYASLDRLAANAQAATPSQLGSTGLSSK
jgi:membrane-bound lytic murein transglycosylase C